MTLDPLSILFLITAIAFVVFFILLPRFGPHYTSRLTCPNCKRSFNFHWVPGATLTSLVNRNRRTLKCPYCHVKSTYNIASTRVSEPKTPPKAKPKA